MLKFLRRAQYLLRRRELESELREELELHRALTRERLDLLFEISPTDPVTFAGVAAVLAVVTVVACWLPARGAARVDPIRALRCE